MSNFKHRLFGISILLFLFTQHTRAQPLTDSQTLAVKKLEKYLLKTSKTTEKVLPPLLKEGLLTKREYDSIIADNNQLKSLINSNLPIDSAYLSKVDDVYATIDGFIFYIKNEGNTFANVSKKLHRKIVSHLKAVREADQAISNYNYANETQKHLRFGKFVPRRPDPI